MCCILKFLFYLCNRNKKLHIMKKGMRLLITGNNLQKEISAKIEEKLSEFRIYKVDCSDFVCMRNASEIEIFIEFRKFLDSDNKPKVLLFENMEFASRNFQLDLRNVLDFDTTNHLIVLTNDCQKIETPLEYRLLHFNFLDTEKEIFNNNIDKYFKIFK